MIKLVHGDFFDIYKNLPKGQIIITDPPYNAGKCFDNDNLTEDKWIEFCNKFSDCLKEIEPLNILCEISKKDIEMQKALDKNFKRKWIIVLNYTNSMRNGGVGYSNTGIVLYYGGKVFKRYKDRIDSACYNTIKEFKHPSPKQIIHYQKLCEMFCNKELAIIDPFMGSGTTGVAAMNIGLRFVGVEIHRPYFDEAGERIASAQAQGSLFHPAQAQQSVQEALL